MRRLVIVSTVLLTLFMLSLSLPPATTHASTVSSFISLPHGYGFAGYVDTPTSSSNSQSGPIAQEWIGCTTNPMTVTNTAANVSLASYAQTGNAETTITSTHTDSSANIQTTAKVDNINLLQGLITANEVQAVASSTATPSGASSTEDGTNFAGLQVAGNAISSSPQPNTRLELANLGYVVLNELGVSNGPGSTYMGINLIDVYVTQSNSMGVAVGTRIIIADVNSSETQATLPVYANVSAYSLSANGNGGSSVFTSGPWSLSTIDCAASSSQQNGVQGNVNASPYGTTGVVNTTATGQFTSTQVTATGQTTIQNLKSLNGMVSIGSINSQAQVIWNTSGSASGTVTFTNGSVNGVPIGNNPSPNQRMTLLGVGYIVFNEQNSTVNGSGATQTVNALDIHVTQTNLFNIPIGTDIIIGHADASAYPFS